MATVYGNLQGLKASYIKRLEQLYEQRQPSNSLITPELAQQLADVSINIHQPVCCYINRRGQIVRVAVGTPAQSSLPDTELPRRGSDRLSGVRCVAVQHQSPDTAALIAMVRQRLDALIVLVVANGRANKHENSRVNKHENNSIAAIQETYLAHLAPDIDQPWIVSPPLGLDELVEEEFDDLVHDWEKELQNAGFDVEQFQGVQSDHDRVLLVGLMTEDISPQHFEDGLTELVRLVESAGGDVVGVVQQKRSQPHPQTVVGQGKVEEIALQAQSVGANLVVFDRDISASQARNLEDGIGLRVVDRTGVILDIFAQRAQSQAGKLQVELAQMEYLLPRLRGRGREMSRLGAGIGTRGPGETKLETERRTIQRRIAQLQHEVNQLQAHRSRLRHQRERQNVPVIALVGYTNAGKSTLLNVMTQAEVYTADQLFATLDPTTRRLTVTDPDTQERHDLLLTDTVGFIHHLPPPLMDSFRATLEEVTEATALLHVVDLSHPAWESHIHSVEEILADLPGLSGPVLIAFNKIDRVDSETLTQAQYAYPDAVYISATERLGLETLRIRLLQLINTTASDITSPAHQSIPDHVVTDQAAKQI